MQTTFSTLSQGLKIGLKTGYGIFVPSFIDTKIQIIQAESIALISTLYIGPPAYRYQEKEGQDFLREKSFYPSTNQWELGRTLLIAGIIGTLGCFLLSSHFVLIGYTVMTLTTFLTAATLYEYSQGNQLKKALEMLITTEKMKNLAAIQFTSHPFYPLNLTSSDREGEWVVKKLVDSQQQTIGYIFKCIDVDNLKNTSKTHFKAYYIGNKLFRSTAFTSLNPAYSISCKPFLEGREIKRLMTLASQLP